MQALSPTFVTCTWGAGGSTFEKTTELSAVAQTVHGLETCMHLTCTNMDRGKVDDALEVCVFCPRQNGGGEYVKLTEKDAQKSVRQHD